MDDISWVSFVAAILDDIYNCFAGKTNCNNIESIVEWWCEYEKGLRKHFDLFRYLTLLLLLLLLLFRSYFWPLYFFFEYFESIVEKIIFHSFTLFSFYNGFKKSFFLHFDNKKIKLYKDITLFIFTSYFQHFQRKQVFFGLGI